MLAAVVEKPYQFEIKEIPTPQVTDDSFLVKVEASSICNATDNHIVEGIFDGGHDRYPQILEHEVCGIVVEKGKNVNNVELGERVAQYSPNGAFAEYVLFHKDSVFAKVPATMTPEEGCICEMFNGAYECLVEPAELQRETNRKEWERDVSRMLMVTSRICAVCGNFWWMT